MPLFPSVFFSIFLFLRLGENTAHLFVFDCYFFSTSHYLSLCSFLSFVLPCAVIALQQSYHVEPWISNRVVRGDCWQEFSPLLGCLPCTFFSHFVPLFLFYSSISLPLLHSHPPNSGALFRLVCLRSYQSCSREASWVKFPLLLIQTLWCLVREDFHFPASDCVCVCADVWMVIRASWKSSFNCFSLLCCRWSFGDGGYKEFEYKPPYPPSLVCFESPNQVLLSNNVTYIYSQPGISLSAALSIWSWLMGQQPI